MESRIITVAVLVLAGVIAAPALRAQDSASPPPETSAGAPFAGLDRLINEEGPDLGLTQEQQQAEEDFLRVMPRGEVGEVPKARTANVPYRRCEKDPFVASKAYRAASADASVYRMIYDYVRSKRVLDLRDCTCHGKVAPFTEVTRIIAEVEARNGKDWNRHDIAREYSGLGLNLFHQAKAMCGGTF